MLKVLPTEATSALAPDFSTPVARNGYAWWYFDALSEDGEMGLTIIAMIGSVFSPYYARARRRGAGDPENYCGLNVALYGRGGKRWALTERGRNDVERTADRLRIGPSSVRWIDGEIVIDIDEWTNPYPSRLQGTVRLRPSAFTSVTHTLDDRGGHRWRPIAPVARVAVDFSRPSRQWTGHGYFDFNRGDEPLEAGFSGWHWSRAASPDGATIFYDCQRRRAGPLTLALKVAADGSTQIIAAPPAVDLPATNVWKIARVTRADQTTRPRIVQTCEDTPFYARSIIDATVDGRPMRAMHESLSLDRFDTRWVQALLPFRMPRNAR